MNESGKTIRRTNIHGIVGPHKKRPEDDGDEDVQGGKKRE